MVVLPIDLEGLTVYPAYGKIVLSKEMTKEETLEAQKIYPQIKWIEQEKPKRKTNKK